MTAGTVTRSRVPSMLDPSPISSMPKGEAKFRIHPDDLRELREAYRFIWPGNGPRDRFCDVLLIEDATAPRLPRRRL